MTDPTPESVSRAELDALRAEVEINRLRIKNGQKIALLAILPLLIGGFIFGVAGLSFSMSEGKQEWKFNLGADDTVKILAGGGAFLASAASIWAKLKDDKEP
jgi:hypothetical protein